MKLPSLKPGDCCACDADKQSMTRGQAFIAGVVLGAMHGFGYANFEEKSMCKFHREQYRAYKAGLEEHQERRRQ